MTKIKYDNYEMKKEMSYYQSRDDKELEKLLSDLMERYKIENPIVVNIEETYDYFNVVIKEKSIDFKKCLVSFPLFSESKFTVKFNGKYYYDVYDIYEDLFFIEKRVYENNKKECILEKIYTKNENDKLLRKENDISYYTYQYIFSNSFLNCKIAFSFPTDTNYNEISFIKNIFSNDKIDSIFKLYQIIRKNISNDNYKILLSDSIKGENLTVENGQILSYKHNVLEDNNETTYEYDKGKLYITKEEQPEQNSDYQKILRLIKGEKNEK